MSELEVTDANFQAEVLNSPIPVLVDFWAPWCGPCRMLGPVVAEIAQEYAGKAKVGKLNTDANEKTAGQFRISSIPNLMFFKGGQMVDQMVGVQSKSEIKKKLDALIG